MVPIIRRGTVGLAAAIAVGLLSFPLIAQTNGSPERFTALAVNTDRGGTSQVEIAVDRWSTDAERSRLMNTLLQQGPEKLLDVLRDMPKVGYIRRTTSIGWDLHYAQHNPLPDGGERVVVATDRPVSEWEAFNQPPTVDYPFTVIELHLNANGEGEGKMSYATRITGDPESNTVVLENWGTGPVLLQGVRREK